eukprot:TRINITY_DN440_c0_g2_i1.p1 TRINITY_DN440_c0_g2~~TRINITY_DN440_c0_g2_i1.p1  ORF type:complete len:427 (-),score=100.93 TRINITY_DN440_c0_g2_i1:378-1658(-)
MARMVIASTTPGTVAQRLTELLQNFPAAAAGGVQWSTLVRKYEERHSARLDLAALGYDSPLAATTALLWEVLRLVDSEDTDNPVVAVEDSMVLAPKPGFVASWPSLYKVLCNVVQEHGSIQEDNGERGILVSQLKQLLQRHWHSTFDESSFSYFTEEGSVVKIKKMKHLLTAVLRWRMQRMEWVEEARGRRSSEVDKAMELELQLVPSKRHNDLILRIERPCTSGLKYEVGASLRYRMLSSHSIDIEAETASSSPESTAPSIASATMQDEIAALRAENDALRRKNNALEFRGMENFQQAWARGTLLSKQQLRLPPMDLPEDLLDNPFEPPPQVCSSFWGPVSPSCSTGARSSCFSSSNEGTPLAASSCSQSGTATPVPFGAGQAVALVPVGWFAMGDRVEIPSGLVQNACAIFERHTTIPNWFAQQ